MLVGDERETKSPKGLNSQRHIQSLNKCQRQPPVHEPSFHSLICTKQCGGMRLRSFLTYTQIYICKETHPKCMPWLTNLTKCTVNHPTSHMKFKQVPKEPIVRQKHSIPTVTPNLTFTFSIKRRPTTCFIVNTRSLFYSKGWKSNLLVGGDVMSTIHIVHFGVGEATVCGQEGSNEVCGFEYLCRFMRSSCCCVLSVIAFPNLIMGHL